MQRRRVRELVRRLPAHTRDGLRGHDLMLYGAGVTFYAALAVVPVLFIATRVLVALLGTDLVAGLASDLGRALPSALGADQVAVRLLAEATSLSWTAVLVSLLPATLYGEGLRRAYTALAGVDDSLVGWRGRLAVLPVLCVAPGLLLCVLAVTPLLADLFGRGASGVALGVYVALNVDWLVVSLPLAWTFRVVAADPPPWLSALAGGFATGAFVAGFLQGFVLFLSLPLDLGAPFGGQTAVGGVCAVLLWLWVLHLVVLVGWVATRAGSRLWAEDEAVRV
ncbi:MAG TPA: YhjD/YihY/BrkB family envelope integrity protein [Actinomycetales bacterium]|nr:YhjD/YihY/BrkB family envelope integrity protein [Actinomycetales bacterium]